MSRHSRPVICGPVSTCRLYPKPYVYFRCNSESGCGSSKSVELHFPNGEGNIDLFLGRSWIIWKTQRNVSFSIGSCCTAILCDDRFYQSWCNFLVVLVPRYRLQNAWAAGKVTFIYARLCVLLTRGCDARSTMEPLLLGPIPTFQNPWRPWEGLYFFTYFLNSCC